MGIVCGQRSQSNAKRISYFFWEHGGNKKGPHTVILFTHTRNETRYIPEDERKVKKTPTPIIVPEPVDLMELAAKLSIMRANGSNKLTIQEGMAKCHNLFLYLSQQIIPERIDNIINTFPHILSYKGLMVQQLFQRVHGDPDNSRDMENVLSAGTLLDKKSFLGVINHHLRGALRIMKDLGHRGISAKHDIASNNPAVSFAAPLIKWVQASNDQNITDVIDSHIDQDPERKPHLVCVASELEEGDYFAVFAGYILPCGPSFCIAIVVFVKTLNVLKVKIPPLLKKFVNFIEVHVLGLELQSKYSSVNKLNARLAEGLGQRED
ncbi:conserved hypothetical protein [Culex quinquefasciatus]|uniref:Uncharacterized protein n=1 Tax=Culex quinquefasciatus TaxID=7176 RepID=B0WPM3_CULQU|nr:conserved hypothetical protein [Culex quinquefasciatus]|eukprot:XP_001850657.1 conserved hypothetical protein [Culex quinquefasciatus]